jgi:hypothetical protein
MLLDLNGKPPSPALLLYSRRAAVGSLDLLKAWPWSDLDL